MEIKRKIIGRIRELAVLETILKSEKSEFLATFGRRRVGKTFLITNYFQNTDCIFFYVSGMKDHSFADQVEHFVKHIGKVFYNGAKLSVPSKWADAFEMLTSAIDTIPKNKKIVLFFDEFPWMATKKSKLLQALDYYWNRFWVHDSRLKLIICGSAASWVIKNVINNKKGLYNRVTQVLELKPLTLSETKEFLCASGIKLNNDHILKIYMVFGGIPYYLAMIKKGLSADQCIDQLCFSAASSLFDEFERLFSSLFDNTDIYIKIIKLLAKHRNGLGQNEIIGKVNLPIGGRANQRLKELEQSGFIASYIPHQHSERGVYYKVVDEFTLFYLHWIEPNKSTIKLEGTISGFWQVQAMSPSWNSWSGYSFEAVCFKHIAKIRKALNISVGTNIGTWRYSPWRKTDEKGAQIDLLFDRKDNAVTICEIKYSKEPFIIDKEYAAKLQNKVVVYRKHSKTKKQIFIAMISAHGLKPTMYSEEMVSGTVTLDDLF